LDAIDAASVSPEFDRALAAFVRAGGGLLLLGGPPPGVTRFARGELARDLAVTPDRARAGATGVPAPAAAALDLLQWDDDPARGSLAWRAAAPLVNIVPLAPSAGDRLLIASTGDGVPLLWSRHVGRGQALFV